MTIMKRCKGGECGNIGQSLIHPLDEAHVTPLPPISSHCITMKVSIGSIITAKNYFMLSVC
jgi:hypothetical protein